ncbi:GGDEF domain-containing protein [Thiolapillus brandeum]|nr:GGDEF domain-containing protein [Thiolapillus brandeum]
MKSSNREHQRHVMGKEWLKVFLYASPLFAIALTALWHQFPPAITPPAAVLGGFFAYSLFSVAVGYRHPYFGYISMDRAGQLLCLLTLGGFHAAWISGLSYFLFSWGRLRRGIPLRNTINAVLFNTGTMTLMLLLASTWYEWVGGETPLVSISLRSIWAVFSTLVVMQIFNELAMYMLVYLRGGRARNTIVMQASAIEIGNGMVGMTLALVYNRQDTLLFLLVLITISIGMLVMKQYANIRLHLEALVKERTHALEDQAQRDALTGISNRRHANAFVSDQIEHARKTGADFSVVLIDVDHFKRINDNYLHTGGDQVLRQLASILTEHCRAGDLVGRYGGEEFLICFPMLNLEQARLAAEKLRLVVEEYNWADINPGIRLTISLGVAQWKPGMLLDELIMEADGKLYEAKSGGRNRVCY